jgi:hypothetical protein
MICRKFLSKNSLIWQRSQYMVDTVCSYGSSEFEVKTVVFDTILAA